jgi:hypothetical protein
MTIKPAPSGSNSKKQTDIAHPGMMGDGTEEQSLDERGNPAARIKKVEVDAAFAEQAGKQAGKKF